MYYLSNLIQLVFTQYGNAYMYIIIIFGIRNTKGVSETVNLRRTENTMPKRKRTRVQIIIYKALHRKLKIEQYKTH